MKSLTRRVLALFLALTMVLDMAMPVWAEEVNGTDNQASQVVTCVEDDCDCCEHEHEHEHEHIEASEGLVVTNPEEKVEEPEKEEKGIIAKTIDAIVGLFAKTEKVEESEETKEELDDKEIEIPDDEIPVTLNAEVENKMDINSVKSLSAPVVLLAATAPCNHTYNKNLVEKCDETYHWKYCDNCGNAVKEEHTKGNNATSYDCKKHTYTCTKCGEKIYEEHEWEDHWFFVSWQECKQCGVTNNDRIHNYVYDKTGEVTYDTHTVKCTGCGKKTTEEHDLSSKTNDTCPTCGIIQKYMNGPKGMATHRYVVDVNNCTIKVKCLSPECSDPERTFGNDDHGYTYKNITSTKHDECCTYCNYCVTEDHVYDITRNGKKYCKCGKEQPPCDHTFVYEEIDNQTHRYVCSKCELDGTEKHTWDNGVVTTPATCTEDGVRTFTCTKCQGTRTETISKLGHTTRHESKKDSTCTEIGYEAGEYCTRCKEYVSGHEEIAPKGHVEVIDEAIAATCTQGGKTEGKHCSRCEVILVAQTDTQPLGHDYKGVVTEPTCTKGGYTTYTCSRCNDSYKDDETNALGHLHEDANWEEVKAATCTEKGKEKNLCSRCKEEDIIYRDIEALGHDYKGVVTEPTCTKGGYTTHTCSRCKDSYTDSEVPALGHDWDNGTQTVDPTCTEKGNMHFECSRCEATKDEDVAALGHQHRTVDKKDATCLEDGYTKGDYCDRCQTYTSGHEVIKAKGHKVSIIEKILETCLGWGKTEGEKCSVCGAILKAQEDVEPLGHDWGEWEVTTAPTCTTDGVETKVCARDNSHTETRPVAKLGHKYESEVVAPTCLEDGYTLHTCSVCGHDYKDEIVPATGHKMVHVKGSDKYEENTEVKDKHEHIHTWIEECTNENCTHKENKNESISCVETEPVVENKVESKCNAQGSYDLVVYCRDCNKELSRVTVPVAKLPHTPGEKVTENVIAPICTEDGNHDEVVYCTVCKEEVSRVNVIDEALGHDMITDAYVAPTCTATGLTEGSHCSRCEHKVAQEEIKALGHDMITDAYVAPTCTTSGLTEGSHCSRCEHKVAQEEIKALGHKPANAVREKIKDSTCTEEGSYDEVVYCETCKAELSRTPKTIEKKAHTKQIKMGKLATCLVDGYTSYEECAVCHEHLTEPTVLKALGHDFEHGKEVERVDSDCTNAGHYTKKCIRCQETQDYPIAAKGHKEGQTVIENKVAPTCTVDGSHDEVVYCTECEKELSRTPVVDKALGHNPNEPVIENFKDSTCTEEGSYDEVVYCETCKAELSRTPKTIEKKAHTKQIKMGKLATCLVDGYTSYEECAVCHTHLTEPTVLKALGHDFEHGKEVERVDSDCTNAGHYTMKCIRCQETHEYPIAAKGHTEVPMMTKMATCEAAGETGGVKCSVCNTVIVEPTVIPAHGHVWGEWKVTTDPTCFEEGVETRVCIHDKRHTETRPIRKTEHNFVKVDGSDRYEQIEKDAQQHKHVWTEECTNEGCTETRTCDELLSHHLVETHVDPTCTKKGYDYRTCSDCGYYYERNKNAYPALGHDFTSEDAVELERVEPTCTEDGYKVMKCSRCDAQDTITLTKLGHDYKNVEGTDTYVPFQKGWHTHKWDHKCERCNKLQHLSETLKCTAGDPVIENKVEATCAKEGSYDEVVYCTECKQELSRETKIIPIDTEAHAYGEWYRWVEPTCTKFGYMRRDCANTNAHYESQAIAAKGHDKEHGTWQVKTKAGNETEGLEVLICGRDNCEEEIDARTIHERNITVEPKTVTYNGDNQVGAIVPSEGGYSVEILKGNDKVTSAVNAGEYKLVFTFPETREYNTIILEAVLTIEPAKINPDNIKEELQALMDKNIDKDYDGTNTVLFDEDDEMTIALDEVEVKVTGTFANELPGENKSADILLAIQDENGNYVFANNETEMSLQKEGNINVIKLTDTFGDINLPNNMIDKKEVSKEIDKKLDKSHRDIKDFKFNDAKISDGEYDIPEVTVYGTKLPASVTFTVAAKDDEGNDVVIIEKKVTGTITYNYSSGKKKQKKQEQIKDIETPLGLDFEYIDLPRNIETPSDWAKDDIYDLTFKGIVNGYEDMTYRPNNMIRRDEFAKLAYLVLSLKENENGVSKDFEDTKGNWAEEMIRVATTVDVLRGYDDTFFGPADNITNEQMMAILVRGLKYLGKDLRIDNDEDAEEALKAVVDGAEVSDWAKYDAATAVKYGLFIGNENKEIKPLGFTTRAQVAVILERYMNLVADLLK